MCFLEFIGFTCGHTSLPVLRPCPLTTASHTFPTCPRRADKPFLAGEMCSACQKIVHSRATQIEEFEHRFMHERGVCGCDTVFPYLIRPRTVGGGEAGEEGEVRVNGSVEDELEAGEEMQLPPILRETTDAGGRAVVSVRLPSLFAAEWVADHRERHDSGLCDCHVDFRTYRQVLVAVEEGEDVVEGVDEDMNGDEGEADDETLNEDGLPLRRVSSWSTPARRVDEDDDVEGSNNADDTRVLSRSASHGSFTYFRGDTATASTSGDDDRDADTADGPDPANRNAPDPEPPRIYAAAAVRFAGAVFADVPTYLPLTGPFLAQPSPFYASSQSSPVDGVVVYLTGLAGGGGGEADDIGRRAGVVPVPGRIAHHIRHAARRRPLVGFPLGAGPEGVLHAIPWGSRPACWWRR